MELIRKIEKPILKKVSATNLSQQLELEVENIKTPERALEAKQKLEETCNKLEYGSDYYYSPRLDNPPAKAIESSGWQVSDIWREIRVDSYCDSW
ncbi:hypothetical protein [Nostoc sp. UIC 10630]|uniref:hypothetical protein n=1 Tax=Nostoc sp. UIC 10630 TaxID=2100146 RepID=UPI0013D56AE5|nr:hypothetical protein [Nostoc sp. UIC 10630]NEU84481.1 hypothetical protein [Nostoc sp. UIC 10630]